MKFIWPPLIGAIEKRQRDIADGLSTAERAKKDLEIAQTNSSDLLVKAKADALVIIEQANKKLNRLGFAAVLATIGSVEKVKEQRQSLPVK